MFENYALGFCIWDIPALISFIIVATALFIQQHKHRKRMKEAKQILAEQSVHEDEPLKIE